MFSRTALGRPGRLTMSVSWRRPAAARESAASGSTLSDSRSSSSEMPGVWGHGAGASVGGEAGGGRREAGGGRREGLRSCGGRGRAAW